MFSRRDFIARASASAMLPFAFASGAANNAEAAEKHHTPSTGRNYVTVHGAWTGGWHWRQVARRLRSAGHEVFAPTLTGLGERVHLASPDVDLSTHIQDIVNVLYYEDLRDVVLVGHSYAGMVITSVAERVPDRLARLVYVDAYVPKDGQSLADLLPEEVVAALKGVARDVGDGWRIPHNPPDADRRTDFPMAAGLQPVAIGNPDAALLPRAYVACLESHGIPLYSPFVDAARRAKEEGWEYFELPTGHLAMETMPNELADILLELG